MNGQPEMVLTPTFDALRQLRLTYKKSSQLDADASKSALRIVRGLLRSARVHAIIDAYIARTDPAYTIPAERRTQVLSIEADLAKRIGGLRDMRKIKRAIERDNMPQAWCRSTEELVEYLVQSHAALYEVYEYGQGWLHPRKRRKNRDAIERADDAVVAVGLVLVDAVEVAFMDDSYHIGASLASAGAN